jgi:hypothetical protein
MVNAPPSPVLLVPSCSAVLLGAMLTRWYGGRAAVLETVEPVGCLWFNRAGRAMRDPRDATHWPVMHLPPAEAFTDADDDPNAWA